MTTWHKGPPPSVGWWPASTSRCHGILRWWNGEYWSMAAEDDYPIRNVAQIAKIESAYSAQIEWKERPEWWPERSKT